MGTVKRSKASRHPGLPKGTRKPHIAPPPKPDHNEVRRKLYASDPGYAERQRELARQTYRRDNPLPPTPLARGPLTPGTRRECVVEGELVNVVCYTVPEAARALGKGELTVKRWIEEELIPGPVLTDTSRGYRQYSYGELRVLAAILALHEQEYSYYAKSHVETRERIERDLAAYRNRYV